MPGIEEPDWYSTVAKYNRYSDNTYLQDQYDKFWEEQNDNNLDELQERYGERFSNQRSGSQYRKNALTTVMGAFLNHHRDHGQIYEQTGWEFRDLDSSERRDGVSADILLAKPNEGKTMVVMLLPKRKPPEAIVKQATRGIEAVQDNLSRADYQTKPDEVYGAIVVNPPRDEATQQSISSEGDAHINEIFVWRVYDTEDSDDTGGAAEEQKVIDYYPELDDQLNTVDTNLHLLDILEEGVEINRGREILPDFFLESHHSVFLEHVIGHIVQQREDKGDGPNTHFTRQEIESYIQETLFKQGVSEEARDRTEYLLTRWEEMDLITEIRSSRNEIDGEEFYRFTVDGGMSQDNILRGVISDYKELTINFQIEVDAMEAALNAYQGKFGEQATLETKY